MDESHIVVTDEMDAAARKAHGGSSDEWIPRVYRAMRAVDPGDAVVQATVDMLWSERARLIKVSDAALAACAAKEELIAGQSVLLDAAAGANAMLVATNLALNEKLMAERAETMRLRDQVALLTPAEPAPVPVLEHNPFRDFGGDRRRIGT